jgi:HlyD family secretion protein
VKKVVLIAVGAVVLAVLILLNVRSHRGSKREVEVSEVVRRKVEKIITSSGAIQPKRQVNVGASAIGKVTKVAVQEGDYVREGDFLLEIDPTTYRSAYDQAEAGVRGAEAALDLELANQGKAKYDHERALELGKQEFVSEDELRNARLAVETADARVKAARESLLQQRANLSRVKHELAEVYINAEMSGIITALNVEEGESAIMGTMNNPGTVLLTIADLSEMEAEVLVDETEVVFAKAGQRASVTLDAFPDTSFAGVVTEVGNSAIRSQLGLGQESVDFKVVVAIRDSIPTMRPGLTASVDITVAEAESVLTIPIQCLTVRDRSVLEGRRGSGGKQAEGGGETEANKEEREDADASKDGRKDVEGVFVVEDGKARFRAVEVGITGEKFFQVTSGLEEGARVVSGPFDAITDLRDGDPVKIKVKKERQSGSRDKQRSPER